MAISPHVVACNHSVFIFKYIPMAGLSIAFENYSPLFGMFEQEWDWPGKFHLRVFPAKLR